MLESDVKAFDKMNMNCSLNSQIQEQEKLDPILQEMAVMEYEEEPGYSAESVGENTGKPIEEIGPRQVRREFTKKILWFAESIGLIPETLHLQNLKQCHAGSPVKVPLN